MELEDFLGTGSGQRRTKRMQTTLSLSQVIELGGKRQLRRQRGQPAAAIWTATARQAQQLDVLAEVTRRFIAVVSRTGKSQTRLSVPCSCE